VKVDTEKVERAMKKFERFNRKGSRVFSKTFERVCKDFEYTAA